MDDGDDDSDVWGSLSQASPPKKPKLDVSTPFSAKLVLDSDVKVCSRLSFNTASASEWHCSRSRAIRVTHCPDDRGAGVSDVNPDFWVQKEKKREHGPESASEEPDAVDFKTIRTTETGKKDQEEPRTRAGTTDGVRDAGDAESQEPREDTLKSRHVPGGTWLTKVRFFLRDSQLLKREKGGRRGAGRDVE
ncbi:hypothetical protein NDU88_003216 [Pleurodeles waltl]|uniref:Uncharacterized protein n=1 Tax=Pleurodeles waltl TaxID=8319 RepID=A0AAV7QC33_PLEWA|nr:hypothetical protein NDU88_003216 [Pleurodeles waltl]